MKFWSVAAILGLALIAGGVLLVGDGGVANVSASGGSVSNEQATQVATGERLVKLRVDNMYCASCPYIIRQALERTAGVSKASVKFRRKLAIVHYDPSKTDVAALVSTITSIGYPASLAAN